jgi:hypothetical protein
MNPGLRRIGSDIIGGTTFNASFSLTPPIKSAAGAASLDSMTAPLTTLPQPKDTFGAGEQPRLLNKQAQFGSDKGLVRDGNLTKGNVQKDTGTPKLVPPPNSLVSRSFPRYVR